MFGYPLRAASVACVMAFLAFPAVADTTTFTVTNRSGDRIETLLLDGVGLSNWTGNRVPPGGLFGNATVTLSVDCDPTGVYDFYASFWPSERPAFEQRLNLVCGGSFSYTISPI